MFSIDAERVPRTSSCNLLISVKSKKMLRKVFIAPDGSLRWRPNLFVFPVYVTKAEKRASARRGGQEIVGRRLAYGHGTVVCLDGDYYMTGDIVACLLSLGARPEPSDIAMGRDYFNALHDAIDSAGARWPTRTFVDNTKDPSLRDIGEKALILMGRGEEVFNGTYDNFHNQLPQLVKRWVYGSIELKGRTAVWKRAPVRGGPNAIRTGDPVRGMAIVGGDRVITISQVCFLGSDLYFFLDNGRFPWDEEINWDD